MIDNELWDSQSQLQDGSYFLHEHVLRDQNLHHELIHDMLMSEKCGTRELIQNDLKLIQSMNQDDVCMSEVKSDGSQILDASLKSCQMLHTLENVGCAQYW